MTKNSDDLKVSSPEWVEARLQEQGRGSDGRRLPPQQTLREQVKEFHVAMEVPDHSAPTIPSDARVRLRAALIAEEFFETLEAMFDMTEASSTSSYYAKVLGDARSSVKEIVDLNDVRVNMAELVDGLADLDYVVEGTRIEMGIDGGPIAAEVHRANMAKVGGPIASNGKRLKPPDWTPPDIEGELRKQGWNSEAGGK